MAKRYFRNNGKQGTPSRIAEDQALLAREEAYEDVKKKAIRLVQALKGWPAYDATGNIDGAIDHTLANIDSLDAALDELHDQIDKFRGQHPASVAVMVKNEIGKLYGPHYDSLDDAIRRSVGELVSSQTLRATIVDPGAVTPATLASFQAAKKAGQ